MSESRGSKKPRKARKLKVLTDVEKLDARFSGLATDARLLLDAGVASHKVAQMLSTRYPAQVKESQVMGFRKKRWKPQKEQIEKDFRTLEVLFNESGGNYGLDLMAFARVRELLQTSDIKDANSIRLAVLKIREQDLKEEEFKLKVSQVKPEQTAEDLEAESQEHQRRALRRIKEIFGLPTGEEPTPAPPQVPAAAGSESA
jgi:hypothetical protein